MHGIRHVSDYRTIGMPASEMPATAYLRHHRSSPGRSPSQGPPPLMCSAAMLLAYYERYPRRSQRPSQREAQVVFAGSAGAAAVVEVGNAQASRAAECGRPRLFHSCVIHPTCRCRRCQFLYSHKSGMATDDHILSCIAGTRGISVSIVTDSQSKKGICGLEWSTCDFYRRCMIAAAFLAGDLTAAAMLRLSR